MSKPLYENVKVIKGVDVRHDDGSYVPKRIRHAQPIDDDLRRLCLSTLAVLKRRYPNDWRRMLNEIEMQKAA